MEDSNMRIQLANLKWKENHNSLKQQQQQYFKKGSITILLSIPNGVIDFFCGFK